ncbi:MAG TPA: CHAT domain-containing protein, partial [Kofleriaceae bacterium]|nr:CHAT domain-containing protein [Kofleriaceae bacterium]
MRGSNPWTFTLELARADNAGRPFDCVFAPQTYVLRSAGGGFKHATFPWSDAVLADLAQLRRPDRDPVVVQRTGELLRAFLAPTSWPVTEASVHAAVTQERPVIIAIRSAAAELYALPWELLTIEATGQHLGELPGVLVRYEWPETRTTPRRTPPGAGAERVLLAWSGHVPAADHQCAIADACAQRSQPFDLDDDVLPHASCGRLADRLGAAAAEGRPFTILHLLCHGVAAGSAFGLVLEGDEPGDAAGPVDPGRLRQTLAPHAATLRVVVLAACDSANTGAIGNPMGSVAQALHRAGIAAVIASRFPLSTSGAHRLTRTLYPELLAPGGTVERAFVAARSCLASDARQLDWAALQLYARAAHSPRPAAASSTRDADATTRPAAWSIDALRWPEIRDELSRFRALFSATPRQISLLGGYKELHDVLQDLEAPFNAIVREHR